MFSIVERLFVHISVVTLVLMKKGRSADEEVDG